MRRPDDPIGVFDSGVGGLSVLRALRAALPQERFIYFADTGHAPYGERTDAYVADRTLAVAQELIAQRGVKALVVACNTATAAAIHLLRAQYPDLPLVGVEPALKPATTLTRTGRVAVFATRGTLASSKFQALHAGLASQTQFIVQPCDGLAAAIESGDEAQTALLCERYVQAAGRFGNDAGDIDTLVLGCTHYPFAASHLLRHVGTNVQLVETGEPVARQTRRLLQDAGLLNASSQAEVQWLTTGQPQALHGAAARWLDLQPA